MGKAIRRQCVKCPAMPRPVGNKNDDGKFQLRTKKTEFPFFNQASHRQKQIQYISIMYICVSEYETIFPFIYCKLLVSSETYSMESQVCDKNSLKYCSCQHENGVSLWHTDWTNAMYFCSVEALSPSSPSVLSNHKLSYLKLLELISFIAFSSIPVLGLLAKYSK